ncbi:putative ribonuclease P protein subunit p30 [Monocercomonoides exilis]|uniref:putative ribonuclease P protein subunit p30 n=1 Tax=Monocercomonoides exilis TaxID=2049356 RepID=UPI00355A4124|nr:putative ribonuclease P protein subunit p30 [Monocercomonoides exilis]
MYCEANILSSSDEQQLLKLIKNSINQGYKTLILNHVVDGSFKPHHQYKTQEPNLQRLKELLFPLNAIQSSSSIGGSFVGRIRLFRRVTIVLELDTAMSRIKPENSFLRTFDIVAVAPKTESTFKAACTHLPIEIIQLDAESQWTYRPRIPHVRGALKRGLHFEICYGNALSNSVFRRQLISNLRQLIILTRNKGIILSFGANLPFLMKNPLDLMHFLAIVELPSRAIPSCIRNNIASALSVGAARRADHGMIEVIPRKKKYPS